MGEVLTRLRNNPQFQGFDLIYLPLESLKLKTDTQEIIQQLGREIAYLLKIEPPTPQSLTDLKHIFHKEVLSKPLILVLDEFDALTSEAIYAVVGLFRDIYLRCNQQAHLPGSERDYLLHGVALIGVRAGLGLENKSGSPFNVQHSLHIPNLTFPEVAAMFNWYQVESGQEIKEGVIERIFYETNGQPGLVGWLGELLTQTENDNLATPLTANRFERVYNRAIYVLPNATILNIISKARQTPYKTVIFDLFKTDQKTLFRYDDPRLNFLYLNGVIDWVEEEDGLFYARFPSPFIQKRLFNAFAYEIFNDMGQLYDPFDDLSDAISETDLILRPLLNRYEIYLSKNRSWLFKDAPRRDDLWVREAVYHFNFYLYLRQVLHGLGAQVWPEFPSGNGKVDLIIAYAGQTYALEIKSVANTYEYKKALQQAAAYGATLGLAEITLVFFIEVIDDKSRAKFEVIYIDTTTGVQVTPIFVVTVA